MLKCIYTIFLRAWLKKMGNSCAFVIKCYKYCKTGKYVIDMYIWLRARKDTFVVILTNESCFISVISQEKFLD